MGKVIILFKQTRDVSEFLKWKIVIKNTWLLQALSVCLGDEKNGVDVLKKKKVLDMLKKTEA